MCYYPYRHFRNSSLRKWSIQRRQRQRRCKIHFTEDWWKNHARTHVQSIDIEPACLDVGCTEKSIEPASGNYLRYLLPNVICVYRASIRYYRLMMRFPNHQLWLNTSLPMLFITVKAIRIRSPITFLIRYAMRQNGHFQIWLCFVFALVMFCDCKSSFDSWICLLFSCFSWKQKCRKSIEKC